MFLRHKKRHTDNYDQVAGMPNYTRTRLYYTRLPGWKNM